jgi:hypothetical protein
LSLFNALRLNRDGAWHLVKSFNKLSDRPIKDLVLAKTFDKFWPDLDSSYRLLFPDSHRDAQESEPLHFVPAPTETVFGSPTKAKSKIRKSQSDEEKQPRLFNGETK